uniref:Uncharacterized protein n=1 Tax=Arundo donax TaxID=35708 RepID=A0A0A8XNA9_ARUDO
MIHNLWVIDYLTPHVCSDLTVYCACTKFSADQLLLYKVRCSLKLISEYYILLQACSLHFSLRQQAKRAKDQIILLHYSTVSALAILENHVFS